MYASLFGQVFWLAVFLVIGQVMERNALKRVVIQGG